ncbi:uncharacterized protein [Diadema setosum]|uniref:uncharacterized protein n=1 Tax=Diadema setosum TaxID=31175 RepID=UPI003B3A4749
MRSGHISSHPIVLAITRAFLGLTLLGRSYLSLAAPTSAPLEYIETPAASTEQLHQFLTDATLSLAHNARHVYIEFKNQRFGVETEVDPRTFKIVGMPEVTELELPSTRLSHSEEDLMETHEANLGIYYSAMEFVISDEAMYMGADGFLDQHARDATFKHIKDHISTATQKIRDLKERKGYTRGVNQTPAIGNLAQSFRNQSDEHFRNIRDLCVLYEIYRYSNEVLHPDARMQASRHSNSDATASIR